MSSTDLDMHYHPIAVAGADTAEPGPSAGPALVADLAVANHIVFDQGVVDAFGHISVRHNKRPDRFLLARNMASGSVTAMDNVGFTQDGDPVDAASRKATLRSAAKAQRCPPPGSC